MLIRRATIGERLEVERLARSFAIWRDDVVKATWRRWKNWEPFPPVIALDGIRIVGFHFFTVNNHYVNCYYIGVAESHRGSCVAMRMLDVALIEARRTGADRFKFKCLKDNKSGLRFWFGLGARPIAESGDAYVFDHSIRPGWNAEHLADNWPLDRPEFVPKQSLTRYLSNGSLLSQYQVEQILAAGAL